MLRSAFGNHEGIRTRLDTTLASLEKAGASLIDVEIPNLEHYVSFTSMYGMRSKSDINAFLASREDLANLKIQDLQAEGRYHKALDLIDVLAKGPSDFTQSPHFARRLAQQSEFQRLAAGVFAKHRLDAIIYPTCQLMAPKTKDVLEGR